MTLGLLSPYMNAIICHIARPVVFHFGGGPEECAKTTKRLLDRPRASGGPITTTLQVAPAGRGLAGNYLQRFTPTHQALRLRRETLGGALMASGLRNVD